MLTLVGLGLWTEKDLTIKGREAIEKADLVYLETYTSVFGRTVEQLSTFFGKEVLPANRKLVEQEAEEKILDPASIKNVVLLVIGDPLIATTHVDLLERARKKNIKTNIIHNVSVFNAVADTGLQLYKFGKTVSIAFAEGEEPETPYNRLKENQSIGAHTLFLLDLKPDENKFMTVNDAIRALQRIEIRRGERVITDGTLCIGVSRLGSADQIIKAGKAMELVKYDFKAPPQALIIPGKMHFMEEEFLEQFS